MPTREESRSEIIKTGSEEQQQQQPQKKPGWLEELSRKQAVRKSGLFKDQERSTSSEEKGSTSPAQEAKPVVPAKPSQIKDEGKVARSGF